MLTKRGTDLKSVVSITTDRAPAMIGRGRGLVARLKEDHPDLTSYHCIIHQSVLCASLGKEYILRSWQWWWKLATFWEQHHPYNTACYEAEMFPTMLISSHVILSTSFTWNAFKLTGVLLKVNLLNLFPSLLCLSQSIVLWQGRGGWYTEDGHIW